MTGDQYRYMHESREEQKRRKSLAALWRKKAAKSLLSL